MHPQGKNPPEPKGFTLVEMLVVIVIIGILAGLLMVALGPARVAGRNTVIHAEIKQMDMALEQYRNEFGEIPPSFVDINIVAERGGDQALQDVARDAVVRHLRKAFPRYTPGYMPNVDSRPDSDDFLKFANDVYYAYNGAIDPVNFDAASSLVFWLGGLPEQLPAAGGQWIPAGFHTDPRMPFKRGTPRTKPPFDFVGDRVVVVEPHHSTPWDASSPEVQRYLRYYPPNVKGAPYVYFKAHRRANNWQYGAFDSSGAFIPAWYYHSLVGGDVDNIAVAYRDPQDPPFWRNYDTFQIISAGLDGQFGSTPPLNPTPVLRVTKTGENFSKGDYDNLANFTGEKRTLEDEIE